MGTRAEWWPMTAHGLEGICCPYILWMKWVFATDRSLAFTLSINRAQTDKPDSRGDWEKHRESERGTNGWGQMMTGELSPWFLKGTFDKDSILCYWSCFFFVILTIIIPLQFSQAPIRQLDVREGKHLGSRGTPAWCSPLCHTQHQLCGLLSLGGPCLSLPFSGAAQGGPPLLWYSPPLTSWVTLDRWSNPEIHSSRLKMLGDVGGRECKGAKWQ